MFLDKIILIYSNAYIFLPVLIFLLLASYFDIKYRKIPNKLNLLFFIIRFAMIPLVGFSASNIYGFLFGFFIILIPAMIVCKPMGGDIKAMAVLGLYLELLGIFVLLVGTIIVSLMYFFFEKIRGRKKVEIPFAPFFLISFIAIFIFVLFY